MKSVLSASRVMLLLFFAFFLSGCSDIDASTNASSLVIVAGFHSNSKYVDTPLYEKIEQIYSEFGSICAIVVDGSPSVARGDDGEIIGYYDINSAFVEESIKLKSRNKSYWEINYLQKQTQDAYNAIITLQPSTPEVDTLSALLEAEKAFNAISTNTQDVRELIIFDTGLSTCGPLDFTTQDVIMYITSKEKLEAEDVTNLIDILVQNDDIPDLTGVRVTWYGLGDVAEPQSKLSNLQISNLRTIWGELLSRANAIPSRETTVDKEYGFFVSTTSNGIMKYDQPVTPILIVEDVVPDRPYEIIWEEKLGFQPNTAEFRSESDVKSVLLPYAECLLENPSQRVLLVGTTADPNRNGGSIVLSEERANAVKYCLVDLGVASELIETIGWGANAPFYNENEWVNGTFNDEVANENRSVIILPYDSDIAQELLSK